MPDYLGTNCRKCGKRIALTGPLPPGFAPQARTADIITITCKNCGEEFSVLASDLQLFEASSKAPQSNK